MTTKERDQIAIFEHIKEGLITQKQASTILKISYRQVKRRYKNYLIYGPDSLIHFMRIVLKQKAVLNDYLRHVRID